MSSKIFHLKHSFIKLGLITFSLSGALLALVSIKPIQAQTSEKNQTIAQLPPGVSQEQIFTSPFQYSYSQNYSRNTQNYEKYVVIVDNNYSGILQQVRSIVSDAFIPNRRPSIIQVGSYNRLDNAQQMAQLLQQRGFNVRIEPIWDLFN